MSQLLTAGALLGITRPEDLFPGDRALAKQRLRELSRVWHPDVVPEPQRPNATKVFAHVMGLYTQALGKLMNGTWEGSAVLNLADVGGTLHTFAIRASTPFELGQSLVGDEHVTHLVDPAYATLFANGRSTPEHFKYAHDKMRDEFSRYLPQDRLSYQLTDGRLVLRVNKTPDLLRLRDVVTHTGALDPKHVAWIVSGLLNLACYLSYTGIVHHDISPDTYFISPNHHSGALLGGWWYARKRGGAVLTVPKRTYNLLPFAVKRDKVASSATDIALIRATALECMGDGCPIPMRAWLVTPGTGTAVEQYKQWADVLERSFGKRRFVKLPVDADVVYGTTGIKS